VGLDREVGEGIQGVERAVYKETGVGSTRYRLKK